MWLTVEVCVLSGDSVVHNAAILSFKKVQTKTQLQKDLLSVPLCICIWSELYVLILYTFGFSFYFLYTVNLPMLN